MTCRKATADCWYRHFRRHTYFSYFSRFSLEQKIKMISYCVLREINQVAKCSVRFKHPAHHWSVVRKKVEPTDKALAHFDDFYKNVFNEKWESIREALLAKHKYIAVVNNYGDAEDTMRELELTGAINVRTLFNLEKEYIKEENQKRSRKKKLQEIWKMDKESDENLQTNTSAPTELCAKDFSLKSSLENAEIDSRRTIDPQNALSSEILHEYIPTSKIKGREDLIPESAHYRMFDTSSHFDIKIEKEYDIHFPDHLNVYCYEEDNDTTFAAAKVASTGVTNYYLMDGGSLWPVLALDLKPGSQMLDVCASPGGKSLLALNTLYPESIVSNDESKSRANKLEIVFRQFLYDFDERWLRSGRVSVSVQDGRDDFRNNFDRILVDVPCTTDRHSLKVSVNSLFKTSRTKERLLLPELQGELLFNALKHVNIGGVVVYSTCSLSPIQNDGVIHMALRKVWEETNLNFVVKDLTPALQQARRVYQFADPKLLRYGHLVLPSMSQNYGPTYFCKLERIK